jgi:hypothetical protein
MNKTMTLVLLIVGAVLLGAAPASWAQTPPPSKNIFVDVNYGLQPSTREFSTAARPVVYGEVAFIDANQGINGSGLLDVTGGYRVWGDLSVAIGLTTTIGGESLAEVTGGIPHPLFYDRRVQTDESLTDLTHKEQAAHVSIMWTSPVTDKMDASVFAGPSYIKVYQDVVTNATIRPGTQEYTPVTEEQTGTVMGVHFGADFTYLLVPKVGIGGMARFVKASVDLPSVPDLSVAGFQFGLGLRVRF